MCTLCQYFGLKQLDTVPSDRPLKDIFDSFHTLLVKSGIFRS